MPKARGTTHQPGISAAALLAEAKAEAKADEARIARATKRKNSEFVADLIVRGGFYPVSGALAGHFFGIISPFNGAVFGAASSLASPFVEKGIHYFFFGHSDSVKVVQFIGTHFLSIVAGIALVTYGLGPSLSMVHAIDLTCTILLTSVITSLVLGHIVQYIEHAEKSWYERW